MLYLLSFGSIFNYVMNYNRDAEYIFNLYIPLFWVADNTFMEKPIEWYVNLFQ